MKRNRLQEAEMAVLAILKLVFVMVTISQKPERNY